MRILTEGTLTVRVFDRDVWKQERNIMLVSDTDSARVNIYKGGMRWTPLATYTLDENREAEIDLSDYIRTNAEDVIIVENDNQDVVFVDYVVVGLINPSSVVVPDNAMAILCKVGFPSVMVQGINGIDTEFELRDIPEGSGWESYGVGGNFAEGSNIMPERVSVFDYGDASGDYGQFIFKPTECGHRYASVRWVSYTGAERVHTWEVQKCKSETAGAYEVLMQNNEYNVVKGRTDGFVIRLDGLNAYDVWYYADVCHSSRVEVSMDGENWQQVDVVTKGATIPDGTAGKLNTLEVELKYKRYDAVAM